MEALAKAEKSLNPSWSMISPLEESKVSRRPNKTVETSLVALFITESDPNRKSSKF